MKVVQARTRESKSARLLSVSILPSKLQNRFPFPRNIIQRVNHKNRIGAPAPAIHSGSNPHIDFSAIRISQVDLNHLLACRPTGRKREPLGAFVALHAERRVAVDRYYAFNGSVASFGVVGSKAPDPETVHVEGCGFGAVNGQF